jgi:hypothetical protein
MWKKLIYSRPPLGTPDRILKTEVINMVQKRKYSKCSWCERTVDVTINDNELCQRCAKYDNYQDMLKNEGDFNLDT